jgi:hypothetical protein
VPVDFFETVVLPLFRGTTGVVYILPEAGPLAEMSLTERAKQPQAN